ncbi:MAG TPA: FGGY family carbohydrate kinase, partial [Verrucomicrobiae bacterium]
MKYILALDQGTTSSRAIVFEQTGKIRAVAQKEFQQIFPQPAWVEHNAEEIWQTQRAVAFEAVSKAGLTKTEIAAIGITNQRETTVVWNRKSGAPICNAIVWQDRRTANFCETLKAAGKEKLIQEKTGLVIDAYFSGSKLRWILENVPNARKMAEAGELAFGTIDSWLVWKLTSGKKHVTDASNASRTMLFNIHSGNWDDELLRLFNIPKSVLPEVRDCSEVYGEAENELAGV